MNTEVVVSLPQSADLAGSEYCTVKYTATGVALSTPDSRIIGTLLRAAEARQDGSSAVGRACAVHLASGNGLSFVKLGNDTALTAGDELEQDATSGRLVKRVSGEAVGIVVDDVADTNDGAIVRAILFGGAGANAGDEYETLAAAEVLTAADNGKTFWLNAAGGFDVTLPALATTGFSCKFIVKTAPTTAYTLTGATADKVLGLVLSSSGAAEDTAGAGDPGDVVNFVASTALPGDSVTVTMDGAFYYVEGKCAAAGGITITG